jgi:gamma-tubulin complex component 4
VIAGLQASFTLRLLACREQLNRLALLGAHFAALEDFVAGELAAGDSGLQPPSLYRGALAHGVSELLDVYRSAVLRVEAHLLRLPAPPPLLSVQHFLAEFEALLPEVAALVGEVRRRGLAGSGVMRALELRARSGAPALQSCAARLLWHCRQVLLKQLESWLVHGLLLDATAEFFVQRCEPGGGSHAAPAHLAASPPPGACLDWQPLEWHSGFQVGGCGTHKLLLLVCEVANAEEDCRQQSGRGMVWLFGPLQQLQQLSRQPGG